MIQALGENLPVRGTGSAQNWSMLQCLVSMPNCRIVNAGAAFLICASKPSNQVATDTFTCFLLPFVFVASFLA